MRYAVLAVGVVGLGLLPARAVDKTAIDRAIERGVAALKAMQQPDGSWIHGEMGATALAGLTLLECGVPKDDRSIKAAARAVRQNALRSTHTYSLSLAVLFLDRLDEAGDTPLIESMIVRLLAGQRASGGWSYSCPTLGEDEIRRIMAEMDTTRTLRGGRDLSKLPAKGKRTAADLPKIVNDQLNAIEKLGVGGAFAVAEGFGCDNSNTQFATLALWVGRRYGVPTQAALLKNSQRFRNTQNPDGGWSYNSGDHAVAVGGGGGLSTAPMTCAGLLGLACGHGAALDVKKDKGAKIDKQDLSKDAQLKAGLGALSTAIGNPIGWKGVGARPAAIAVATGKAYYFLWSLERVAVTMNLDTIAKKDWYNWGAEILLANQLPNGSWAGEYAASGADTCFALLFLKKTNLARDLSGKLMGLKSEARVLKGGTGLGGRTSLPAVGIGEKSKPAPTGPTRSDGPTKEGSRTAPGGVERPTLVKPRPKASTDEEQAIVRLGDDLVKARGQERSAILKKLRDNKGAVYTETLVWAISRLEGDDRRQARVALAERFTRLKESTLREYLKDEESEIRRAAALAAAARGSKVLVPDLIRGLSDAEEIVQRAAYTALKELTGKDFGPAPGASAAQRKEAIAAWLKWWKENARE